MKTFELLDEIEKQNISQIVKTISGFRQMSADDIEYHTEVLSRGVLNIKNIPPIPGISMSIEYFYKGDVYSAMLKSIVVRGES